MTSHLALPPPAEPGMAVADIDTPALVLDLDGFEHNLAAMQTSLQRWPGRLRPHAKAHKSAEIARRQVARGAAGVCCQKVSEAEAMVRGGIGDFTIVNEIVGRPPPRRPPPRRRRSTCWPPRGCAPKR